ncbi:hypothetical protein QOT17_017809 [Balamuthia mandrillaris]
MAGDINDVRTTSTGREYFISKGEPDKNHQAGLMYKTHQYLIFVHPTDSTVSSPTCLVFASTKLWNSILLSSVEPMVELQKNLLCWKQLCTVPSCSSIHLKINLMPGFRAVAMNQPFTIELQ